MTLDPGEKNILTETPPVSVTIIGTGDGGAPLPCDGTVIQTPGAQPNLIVQVVTPIVALVIRFLNVYLGMVIGLLGTAMTSNAIPAPDFAHLFMKCAGLAIGGAVVLSLKDIVTIFSGLEKKFPLATGSV